MTKGLLSATSFPAPAKAHPVPLSDIEQFAISVALISSAPKGEGTQRQRTDLWDAIHGEGVYWEDVKPPAREDYDAVQSYTLTRAEVRFLKAAAKDQLDSPGCNPLHGRQLVDVMDRVDWILTSKEPKEPKEPKPKKMDIEKMMEQATRL